MARILAIDYGRKRTGLAVTDILQITPGALDTVRTCDLLDYLKGYIERESVELFLVGEARRMDNTESESMAYIRPFVKQLEALFPSIPVKMVDERFTSRLAERTIREAGVGKMRRQTDKGLVDKLSAVILLQSYLDSRDTLMGLPPLP